MERSYIAIDLKSFYASIECVERGLDPLTANLVVADAGRTEKTICLAVSPALKKLGIPGRARLFEVVSKVAEMAPDINYIVATPRMGLYVDYSTRIYEIYLKYIAPEDIHVYSIDEVFMDVTSYLGTYKMTPRELAMTIIKDILSTTGITATAGIGTNMYLSKIAMDIVAKHMPPDENGVRIAEINEMTYRQLLWNHTPLTDFWRVGRGISKKLNDNGMYTMGDVARCSLGKKEDFHNEDLLYKLFGVNAELLIDHAWGYEPCTIADVKAYKPESNSISNGQVLKEPYDYEKTKLIIKEMAAHLALDLVDKGLVTDQLVLTIGYDIENLKNPEIAKKYHGEITGDGYGRKVPKQAHGSINLPKQTSSGKTILEYADELFERIINKDLLTRRMSIAATHVVSELMKKDPHSFEQMDLFTDYEALNRQREEEQKQEEKEKNVQKAILQIQKKYGKNALLRGMNLEDGATTIERNGQIGGHNA